MSSDNQDSGIIPKIDVTRLEQLDQPAPTPPRKGFLPMDTNLFDRYFIGVISLVAIHLLWLRFVESLLPLGIATVLSLILMAVIIRRG